MKKLLPKKYRRLLWAGLLACLVLYVLGSLLVPPLMGTQRKSDRQIKLPTSAAERVRLVDGNEEALRWRLRLIRSAQSEIVLSTFDFRADESGSDVVAALLDAAERGVQVRLLVDCPELNAALRAETDEMVRQGRLLLPDGAAVEGAAYTAPEMPLYKKFLQPVLRVVIRPFRYVL